MFSMKVAKLIGGDVSRYSKLNEGAVYVDKTRVPTTAGVVPGETRRFKWFVPKESAPGPNDSPCITWSYYSAVDTIKDTNTGLIGPLIACRKVRINAIEERVIYCLTLLWIIWHKT